MREAIEGDLQECLLDAIGHMELGMRSGDGIREWNQGMKSDAIRFISSTHPLRGKMGSAKSLSMRSSASVPFKRSAVPSVRPPMAPRALPRRSSDTSP